MFVSHSKWDCREIILLITNIPGFLTEGAFPWEGMCLLFSCVYKQNASENVHHLKGYYSILTLNFNTFEEVWKVSDDCQRLIIRLYK